MIWRSLHTRKHIKNILPKRIWHEKPVPMDDIQEEIYSMISSKLMTNLSGRTANFARKMRRARIIRLLQVVTNPRLIVEKDPIYSSYGPTIEGQRNSVRILKLILK